MTKNLNINPYYDDFNEAKNYHQILFRPGYSVQARELTQIQSILQNQIEQFGNHIFRHGSMVIPGNSNYDLRTAYAIVTPEIGEYIEPRIFIGQKIVGSSSGVSAVIKMVELSEEDSSAIFILSYVSGNSAGLVEFSPGETLQLELDSSKTVRVSSAPDAIGLCSTAYINNGVFYVNGSFVHVERQEVIIDKTSNKPSARVLLQIIESIVDSKEDDSLLDQAQGSDNYAAPGADRLKIELKLVVKPVSEITNNDYIELMRFKAGVLEEHARYPKYNELEKSLARRTFDESGDYVVDGYDVFVQENLKTRFNSGDSISGDESKLSVKLTNGKAYMRGFEVESLSTQTIVVDKARTPSHVKQVNFSLKPSFGQFLLITEPMGKLNIDSRETIQLWNAMSGGSQIGTAKVVAIDYHTGDGTKPVYKLFFSDMVLTSGKIEDIGSIRTTTPFICNVVHECQIPNTSGIYNIEEIVRFGTTTRVATVKLFEPSMGRIFLSKHDASKNIPKVGDFIIGDTNSTSTQIREKNIITTNGKNSLIFKIPKTGIKNLKNQYNDNDLSLVIQKTVLISAGSTTGIVSGGSVRSIETGSFVALSASGVESNSLYSIDVSGTIITRSSPAPAGGITIYVHVDSSHIPRTKNVQSVPSLTKASSKKITLNHADVFEIISVVHDGVDIKNRYTLDNGATDYEYGLSSLVLQRGLTVPSGNVVISYKFFSHSTGDFFTVDSYIATTSDNIPSYTSGSGEFFQLRDCIDFRKTVGIANNLVVTDTILTSSAQIYVPRIDSVCVDMSNRMVVLIGAPAEKPIPPNVPDELLELERITIPPYTYSIRDIKKIRVAPVRYTMSDIGDIEERLDRLEEFSTLSKQEADLLLVDIVDAKTGLDRFKSGYLVEDMTDPFKIANAYSGDFAATIHKDYGILPKLEESQILFGLGDRSNVRNTGGLLTLDYTEEIMAHVGESSRITNLNQFLIVSWGGIMTLIPASDIWVERIDLPDITINKEVIVETGGPNTPPRSFGDNFRLPDTVEGPIGSEWDDFLRLFREGNTQPDPALWRNTNPNFNGRNGARRT